MHHVVYAVLYGDHRAQPVVSATCYRVVQEDMPYVLYTQQLG